MDEPVGSLLTRDREAAQANQVSPGPSLNDPAGPEPQQTSHSFSAPVGALDAQSLAHPATPTGRRLKSAGIGAPPCVGSPAPSTTQTPAARLGTSFSCSQQTTENPWQTGPMPSCPEPDLEHQQADSRLLLTLHLTLHPTHPTCASPGRTKSCLPLRQNQTCCPAAEISLSYGHTKQSTAHQWMHKKHSFIESPYLAKVPHHNPSHQPPRTKQRRSLSQAYVNPTLHAQNTRASEAPQTLLTPLEASHRDLFNTPTRTTPCSTQLEPQPVHPTHHHDAILWLTDGIPIYLPRSMIVHTKHLHPPLPSSPPPPRERTRAPTLLISV